MKKKYCVLVLLLLAVAAVLWACDRQEVRQPDAYMSVSWSKGYANLEELTQDSDLIAIISVKGIAEERLNKDLPSTIFTARVEKAISQGKVEEEILIYMTGGTKDGKQIEIIDDPLMKAGEAYLVFCQKNADGTYTVLGGPQGRFVYDDGTLTSLHLANEQVGRASAVNEIVLDKANADTVLAQIKKYLK